MDIIRLSQVEKRFGDTDHIVTGVNLTVAAGDILALIGPNGSGKTTLLRIIAGLEVASSGTVSLEGRFSNPRHVGFVFQNFGESLYPWLNAQENVAFTLRATGVPRRLALQMAARCLERLPMDKQHFEKLPGALSGGQKQLVAFARAIIREPSLLLLDEPFSAIDEERRPRLERELTFFQKRTEGAIVFVTHSISQAIRLSSRIILLGQDESSRPARIWREYQVPNGRSTEPELEDLEAEINAFYRHLEEISILGRRTND